MDADRTVRALEQADTWVVPPARGRLADGRIRIPAAVWLLVLLLALGATLAPERHALLALARGTSLTQLRSDEAAAREAAASLYVPGRASQVIDDLVATAGSAQFRYIGVAEHG